MDLSNEADIKGSPDGTKSNEDSGVEVRILIVNKNYLANSNLYYTFRKSNYK